MLPFIIGISGKIGSGKSTVGLTLSNLLELPVHNLADEGKADLARLLGVSVGALEQAKRSKHHLTGYNKTVREMFIEYMELMRTFKPSYWIDRLSAKLKSISVRQCIVADVRKPNDVEFVHSNNGFHIHIVRPGNPNDEPTERHMDDWLKPKPNVRIDAVITNEGELKELHRTVSQFVAPLITAHYERVYRDKSHSALDRSIYIEEGTGLARIDTKTFLQLTGTDGGGKNS